LGRLAADLGQKVADGSEEGDQANIEDVVGEGVNADAAEEDDRRGLRLWRLPRLRLGVEGYRRFIAS
jgi:hypothetical protein